LKQQIDRGITKQGWVRSSLAKDTKKVEMALKNPFTFSMVEKFNGFKPLDERCTQNIAGKETLSKCFREVFLDKIIHHKVSLFFESGSTIAFLARELGRSKKFLKEVKKFKDEPCLNLYTNNILAYLELWLNNGLPITLNPRSTPGDKYGATYGSLEDDIDEDKCPDYTGNPLDKYTQEAITKLKEANDSIPKNEQILLLGAISGVQISEKHQIHCEEDYCIDDLIVEKVNQCFGFHVGSYKNKIFKRYLIETGYPLVVMFTSEKIDMPIDPTRCHFLFDNDYKWDDFLKDYPIAFCVGCNQDELLDVEKRFKNFGFNTIRYTDVKGNAAVLACNDIFQTKLFPLKAT
jgi:hypothetical protein